MTPFEIFKEGRKREYMEDMFTKESDEQICYNGYNEVYQFEYRHQPNHMSFLRSIHPHPVMVLQHVNYNDGETDDERWMFYVKEQEEILQIHINVWWNGRFVEPLVSFWNSSEWYANQGRFAPNDTLQRISEPLIEYVKDMPAYRLYYVTGTVETKG